MKTITALREKYDGRGINNGFDGDTIKKEDIFLLILCDEDPSLGPPIYMLEVFPNYENALAFIAYGLQASELSHTCVEDCGAITDSYDLTHFTGEYDDPDDIEYFESEAENRNWDPEDVKKWISEMDAFFSSKNKFDETDLNRLLDKFNKSAYQFQIKSAGKIQDFLSSEFMLEEIESRVHSHIHSHHKEKDINDPFLLLRPLVETNCLNLDNEKHLEIIGETLKLLND
ncbi:hypothetical protein [Marinifilum caeruleilacunae]|uniref:Uncharacterized protein n=1 Tax=Marinifilum caeruleilacunae TaxID=2499076 RepID=A0ABX1WWT8_9BACT|nr:hypothetical protein [Marinifilum caeruleilacunae]NOU60584.1 hypothetical protein [Marinifilum caeruleilacunae]